MRHFLVIAFAGALCIVGACAADWQWQLGQQYMAPFDTTPTTDAAKAQFVMGLAFFHNFLFAQSGAAFRAAQILDPTFVMAYWGEAQSYKSGIWNVENATAAIQVLTRLDQLGPDVLARVTDRERAWIAAIRKQYESGVDEHTRDIAYRDAMVTLANQYPNDDELCFAALADITVLQPQDAGYNLRAASVFSSINATLHRVIAHSPYTPCANHYLIHASDTPAWAPAAISAGQRYAKAAPSSWHASHMVSHLLKHLGRWLPVGIYNRRAVSISRQYGGWTNGRMINEDWHSARFIHYAAMQSGKVSTADNLLSEISTLSMTSPSLKISVFTYWLTALQIMELHDYTHAWVINVPPLLDCWDCHDRKNLMDSMLSSGQANVAMLYAVGYAAVERGNATLANSVITQLEAIETEFKGVFNDGVNQLAYIARTIIAATLLRRTNLPAAIAMAKEAVKVELAMGSPSFEPPLFPPAYETLASLQLSANDGTAAYATLSDSTVLPCASEQVAMMESAVTYQQRDYNRASAIWLRAQAAEMSNNIGVALSLYRLFLSQLGDAEDSVADAPDLVHPLVHQRLTHARTWIASHTDGDGTDSGAKPYERNALIASLTVNGILLLIPIILCLRRYRASSSARAALNVYDQLERT